MKFECIHVIANPAAGRDEPVMAVLNRAFRERDIQWDLHITHRNGDGARLAREALEAGADCIAVYGGDGTIMDVANGVYGSNVPMGLLAGGTGNGAARSLNVAKELEQAAWQLAHGIGDLLACDVGCIGERRFLLRVDVGKIVEHVEQHEREDKNRFGILMYAQAILESFRDDRQLCFRLTVDGEEHEVEGSALMLLNMSRIGALHMKIGEDIRPDDGVFNLFVIRNELRALASLVASSTPIINFDDVFLQFRGREFRIETEEPMTVLTDGEPIGDTPVNIHMEPKKIQLFIPEVEQDE